MVLLSRIRDYISSLDNQQFRKFIIIFLGALLAIMGYLIYKKYAIANDFYAKISSVNQQRKRTQKILELSKDLKKQREEVDLLLGEDKNFRLLDYFNKLTLESGLHPATTPVVAAPRDLEMGYNEVELSASFSNINMKQLTELLEKIDKNKRVYTKELIIDKSPKSPMVDIKLVIATLEPATA